MILLHSPRKCLTKFQIVIEKLRRNKLFIIIPRKIHYLKIPGRKNMRKIEEFRELLCRDLLMLQKLKAKVLKSLRKAPEGNLSTSVSNGVTQYYLRTEKSQKKGTYIEKKNKKLITALAQKDYDQVLYKEIEKQEKQIEKILKLFPEDSIQYVYENYPEVKRKYVTPHFITDEQFARQWQAAEYVGNPYMEELKTKKTERGEMVRSKSEKIIADKLYAMGIPYRYECPLRLNSGRVIYPDFTLLKTETREEVYLEHFGMMDRPEYAQKAIEKLSEYTANKIYPGKQLLVTFETSRTSPDMDAFEQMVIENVC